MGSTHRLTTFSLIMMTVVSIDSIRNLPASALLGNQLIAFYLIAGLFFFIPAALVSAHLSALLPSQEGIYGWVKAAFGQKMALISVWLQWMSNVIWYPAILSFVTSKLAYIIHPSWALNPMYLTLSIMVFFWLMTYLSCYGVQISSRFSSITSICGLILPMLLIIVLGLLWLYWGQPTQLSWDISAFALDASWNHWLSLTAIGLSLCGIELTAVHAHDVKDPQKAFPRALFWSTVIILGTLILGSLTIAEILPAHDISLIAGIMQMIERFLSVYHIQGFSTWFAGLLVLGGTGSVLNWIIGPTRGLMYAFHPLTLPKILVTKNKHGAPVAILVLQGLIVVALSSLYCLFDEINQAYWVLTAAASQLYMLMYLIMFFACWKLRTHKNARKDVFAIPGGEMGISSVSFTGLLGSFCILVIGFMPPIEMHFHNKASFVLGMMILLVMLIVPTYFLNRLNKA